MDRLSTGIPAFDRVLGGGFPRHSVNILMGLPGTGKTLLAEQLAFVNGSPDRPALYLTTVSEPLAKVISYLQEMGFADLDRVGVDVIYESMAEVLGDRPESLVDAVAELVARHRPSVVVIDSLKAVVELMPGALERRNLVFALAGVLSAFDLTSFWVGEYAAEAVSQLPEFAVADGIVELTRRQTGARDDRFISVVKLRGSSFLDGQHAIVIGPDGLQVYPRLVGPSLLHRENAEERLQTGIGGLDEMVETGWLRGTSTLVAGPSGGGKTMLALHFLRRGVEDGEAGLIVTFQENPTQLRRVMANLGWETDRMLQPGALDVLYTSPVELQIDTILEEAFRRIERHNVQRVVVDALCDIEKAGGDECRFSDYVYALNQELAARGVTSMLTVEAAGVARDGQVMTGKDVSYMSDNILLLAMNLGEDLTRTVRIIKTRGSAHDGRPHVLHIGPQGMVID